MPHAFRLIPVPMNLDDPRWRGSWLRKPCIVVAGDEDAARDAATLFFATAELGRSAGSPWSDPVLVHCGSAPVPARAVDGGVYDMMGEPLRPTEPVLWPSDARPHPCEPSTL